MLLDRGSLPSEINCRDLAEGQTRASRSPQLGPRDSRLSPPNALSGTVSSWAAGGEAFRIRVQPEHPGPVVQARSLLNVGARQAPSDSQNASGFPPGVGAAHSCISRSWISWCHQRQWSEAAKSRLWNQIFLGLHLKLSHLGVTVRPCKSDLMSWSDSINWTEEHLPLGRYNEMMLEMR